MTSIDWTSFGILQGEGASEDSIAEVERRIGCPLPAAYVDLARFRNGASPEIAAFRFGEDETCISDFFEITSSPDLLSVLWYRKLPRQVDTLEVEPTVASSRSRYSAGGRFPSASCGRSSL
ncbi:SMI1/KNR4 family protein [Pandoraea sp. NPDC087047]|uniref:SMI1/KNR4 family protein n=1 Tax=Pandoraea sp. NPDC087047 TaxID=3364390 RepID=UPI0038140B9F